MDQMHKTLMDEIILLLIDEGLLTWPETTTRSTNRESKEI